MKEIASELENRIIEYLPLLKELNEARASLKPSPVKWSKKEILGHLVDSAQNNLRRFIVAQYEENPKIIYQQDDWVRINNYQNSNLEELVQLWYLINRQMVTVLRNTKNGDRVCDTGELHTIKWLASDYIKHLRHHLHQVLDLTEVPYP
jgi:DinB superfamily